MSGQREQLAKAVVLASVQAATRQGRECRVVSFSSANNAIECDALTSDAGGVRRLLDFLQSSFEGGTDVTGALKFAVSSSSSADYYLYRIYICMKSLNTNCCFRLTHWKEICHHLTSFS